MELEICVDSVESAIAAQRGGAQRLELCSALSEAGLTPGFGMIRAVRQATHIALHMMIRPRGGDFLYSEEDFAVMQEDIRQAARMGADGVVFGLLTADGNVDIERTKRLVEAARPLEVTFHRAIDMTRDIDAAIDDIVECGADRVLTSGGAQTALLGAAHLSRIIRSAGEKIQVMVCGGIRPDNVRGIAQSTGATQFHAALRQEFGSQMIFRPQTLHLSALAADDYSRKIAVEADVASLRAALDALM